MYLSLSHIYMTNLFLNLQSHIHLLQYLLPFLFHFYLTYLFPELLLVNLLVNIFSLKLHFGSKMLTLLLYSHSLLHSMCMYYPILRPHFKAILKSSCVLLTFACSASLYSFLAPFVLLFKLSALDFLSSCLILFSITSMLLLFSVFISLFVYFFTF